MAKKETTYVAEKTDDDPTLFMLEVCEFVESTQPGPWAVHFV